MPISSISREGSWTVCASAIAVLHPAAQRAAATDLTIIETQMLGNQVRLDLWCRVWELRAFGSTRPTAWLVTKAAR